MITHIVRTQLGMVTLIVRTQLGMITHTVRAQLSMRHAGEKMSLGLKAE